MAKKDRTTKPKIKVEIDDNEPMATLETQDLSDLVQGEIDKESKRIENTMDVDIEIEDEDEEKEEEIPKEVKIRKDVSEEDEEVEEKINKKEQKKLKKAEEELMEDILDEKPKKKRHIITHFFLIILLLVALGFFGLSIMNNDTSLYTLICNLILTLFTIIFVGISFAYDKKSKFVIFIGSLLLLSFFLLNINNTLGIIDLPIKEENSSTNFQGKSLTEVIKWANKNKVSVNQQYEYSDMIPEYKVISQELKKDKNNKITEITVAVSEGANPSKEIMVPNMVSWDDERVVKFVNDNYLSNVNIEFVSSDKAQNTVIEQNTSGTMKRNDELKLTFSYGEELGFSEVKLSDLTNMSKFEVELYMKKNQLKYKLSDDFSKTIKKGHVAKQSIKAGETVKINDQEIEVTLSKGPKIKVPELKNMTTTEITEWAIKNRIKLSFIDKYDSDVKENSIIEVDHKKGDIVEQGSVIKVTLSRGALKMPKFKSLDDFYDWANKYEIKYEEKHEFSDKVKAGEVIKYSYKAGEAIKNNDIIIVTISDGEKTTVPNLKGLTKDEAAAKLKKLNLKYSFVYEASDSAKNKVIDQSIKAGSEISSNTTITVTLSNGKKESSKKVEERKNNTQPTNNSSSTNNNSNTNNNSGNSGGSGNTPAPEPQPVDCSCNIRPAQIQIELDKYDNCSSAASGLRNLVKSKCPNVNISVSCVNADDSYGPGQYYSGYNGGSTNSCSLSTQLAN